MFINKVLLKAYYSKVPSWKQTNVFVLFLGYNNNICIPSVLRDDV